MSYTKFGELFRILRIKHHEVLADAKEFLGVSTAFISSVECGKKSVPDDWAEKISDHYGLSAKEKEELIEAIDQSKKTMRIDLSSTSDLKKSVALQFQRSFQDADEETMLEIQRILEERKK